MDDLDELVKPEEQAIPRAGMVISVRTRQDVIVTDPERFLAAARKAFAAENPGEDPATVADVYDAAYALIDRYGSLGSEDPEVAGSADDMIDRPDGLSPAEVNTEILLGELPEGYDDEDDDASAE